VPKIFISYRRDDSADAAGRLYDHLVGHFTREAVFRDVDNIPAGKDFRKVLADALEDCVVVLTVIGQKWLAIKDKNGKRRLDNPGDHLRIEIETALEREGITVMPILIGNAKMPDRELLPRSLRDLVFRDARKLRPDRDFETDLLRIVRALRGILPIQESQDPGAAGTTATGKTHPGQEKAESCESGLQFPGIKPNPTSMTLKALVGISGGLTFGYLVAVLSSNLQILFGRVPGRELKTINDVDLTLQEFPSFWGQNWEGLTAIGAWLFIIVFVAWISKDVIAGFFFTKGCGRCDATGLCSWCKGSGTWCSDRCINCKGNGRCDNCLGRGWQV
jgi:hypothetical protein